MMGFAALYPSYGPNTLLHSRGAIRPSFAIGVALEIEEGAGKAGCP
jgi:hypothetical protein